MKKKQSVVFIFCLNCREFLKEHCIFCILFSLCTIIKKSKSYKFFFSLVAFCSKEKHFIYHHKDFITKQSFEKNFSTHKIFLGNNLKTCPNRVQMDQLTFTFVFSKEASSFVRNSNSIGPGVLYQRKNSESLNDIKKGHI